jgi:N-terminal acetyltransferase B complex non-catalytic subunit
MMNMSNGRPSLKTCPGQLYAVSSLTHLRLYLSSFLQSNIDELQRLINLFKLERFGLTESQITAEAEETRALEYTTTYMNGLPYGSDLPDTETQPADDLAILAAHAHLNVHTATGKMEPLYSAVSLLEYGLTKSKHAFQMRLLLIRLYHVLSESRALS